MEEREVKDDLYKMLSESGYSDKAIEYFRTKENMGVLENPDHVSDLVGPCGDTMKVSFNVEDNRIVDARMQILGCPGAVASGCAVVNLARGRTLEEAAGIDLDVLYKDLEKLPDKKIHCARLAIKTLQKALKEYKAKTSGAEKTTMAGGAG